MSTPIKALTSTAHLAHHLTSRHPLSDGSSRFTAPSAVTHRETRRVLAALRARDLVPGGDWAEDRHDVELVNDDATSHNIHPQPANNREWNKAEPPGSKMEDSFAREEIAIPVKCNVHPWMKGYIAVFKHPFFAVTAKDGSFDLRDLPPGTYTIKAWHEKLGTESQTVSIGATESKEITFVFKGM